MSSANARDVTAKENWLTVVNGSLQRYWKNRRRCPRGSSEGTPCDNRANRCPEEGAPQEVRPRNAGNSFKRNKGTTGSVRLLDVFAEGTGFVLVFELMQGDLR
ncbi:hypothetical protein Avbf_10607 [Armadillidium vulgare]|nr:hypothetical protein Avbf_10607 [Armadillidium vulgare]